ncbi:hypothetical protein BX600DRAFT_461102 [Xylariales sp. PMI_506]|nr:hypothetical protein BX600DRAFT_461102 [Xylariales sp. PMI_506]
MGLISGPPHSEGLRVDWSHDSGRSGADRRRVQNRLNQRARRQRQRGKKASSAGSTSSQDETTKGTNKPKGRVEQSKDCSPEDVMTILPRPIDPLRSLSPLLEDWRVRRVFHFGYTKVWPAFDQVMLPSRQPFSDAIFESAVSNPMILTQFVIFISNLRRHVFNDGHDTRLLFESSNKLISVMQSAITSGRIPDELVAIFISPRLDRSIIPIKNPRGVFESPILTIGSLHSMGANDLTDYQVDALKTVLEKRGGIQSIRIPSIAERLQLGTLIYDSRRLKKPSIPLCMTYRLTLAELESLRPPIVESQTQAFVHVDIVMRGIIIDLNQCCRLINEYCEHNNANTPLPLKVRMLGQYRDTVQYRLLSIDRQPPSSSTISQLAIMIFNYGVTFPFPDHVPIRTLSKDLRSAFDDPSCKKDQTLQLLLWAAFMGAMALSGCAELAEESEFFSTKIAEIADELNIVTWSDAKMVMESFLWLDRACDRGGRLIWTNSQASDQPADNAALLLCS